MSVFLRQVDLDRFDRALTTILSPLAFDHCDDWRFAVESTVMTLLDGDHAVFAMPTAGKPFNVHSVNVASEPARAIQTIFGGLPELPSDPWLKCAEVERVTTGIEVWSRLRAFWRAADGQPLARRQSPFIGEVVNPGVIYDSENIDTMIGEDHVALCVSYSNGASSVRRRRTSPRSNAAPLLRMLLPAFKAAVTMRLAHEHKSGSLTLARLGLTKREADVARLLARRATNREIAEQLNVSPHTVRHHIESIFMKLGIRSRRAIAQRLGEGAISS